MRNETVVNLVVNLRTGGFSIEKSYKGHSPEPPTFEEQ